MATVAILGAGGAIGRELVKQLAGRKLRIRLVGHADVQCPSRQTLA